MVIIKKCSRCEKEYGSSHPWLCEKQKQVSLKEKVLFIFPILVGLLVGLGWQWQNLLILLKYNSYYLILLILLLIIFYIITRLFFFGQKQFNFKYEWNLANVLTFVAIMVVILFFILDNASLVNNKLSLILTTSVYNCRRANGTLNEAKNSETFNQSLPLSGYIYDVYVNNIDFIFYRFDEEKTNKTLILISKMKKNEGYIKTMQDLNIERANPQNSKEIIDLSMQNYRNEVVKLAEEIVTLLTEINSDFPGICFEN